MRTFIFLFCLIGGLTCLFISSEEASRFFGEETPISVIHGKASFYGKDDGFHGLCMANGRLFDKEAMTAAHRSLPLGTKVRVRHGSRSSVVWITDRGPYKEGRVIDLSEGAARELQMIEQGVVRVSIEVLHIPDRPETFHHETKVCMKVT